MNPNVTFVSVKNSLGLKSQISVEDVLRNDSRILARGLRARRHSCGKSIHASNHSFLIWHHWSFLTLARVNFFWENTTSKNEPSLYLLMKSDYAQDFPGTLETDTLFYAHTRGRLEFKEIFQKEVCNIWKSQTYNVRQNVYHYQENREVFKAHCFSESIWTEHVGKFQKSNYYQHQKSVSEPYTILSVINNEVQGSCKKRMNKYN